MKLHLEGASYLLSAIRFLNTSSGNTETWDIGAKTNAGPENYFSIENSADGNVFTIKDGNVGIGTTTPGMKLHLEGASYLLSAIRFLNTSSGNTETWDIGAKTNAGPENYFSIENSADGNVFTIKDGKVGIGTAAPATKLEVVGGHLRVDNSSTQIQFAKSGSQKWSVGSLDGTTDKFHIFEEGERVVPGIG